jgi:hypothetical protein
MKNGATRQLSKTACQLHGAAVRLCSDDPGFPFQDAADLGVPKQNAIADVIARLK